MGQRCTASDRCQQSGKGKPSPIKHDRQEHTSDAARALIEVERLARDAKTARLREQRLKAETTLPAESAAKPKRNRKDKKA
ncbi:MAG: hypothetical protein E5Y67_33090 [Mesorhizobium sp.]|nr:MAG: hypothetical protein E5Y67_33090 [Mesorhizobium sp.]